MDRGGEVRPPSQTRAVATTGVGRDLIAGGLVPPGSGCWTQRAITLPMVLKMSARSPLNDLDST